MFVLIQKTTTIKQVYRHIINSLVIFCCSFDRNILVYYFFVLYYTKKHINNIKNIVFIFCSVSLSEHKIHMSETTCLNHSSDSTI